MEKDSNQKVADQKEVIRDLQNRMIDANDEEKQSLQLKLDVAQAKLKELENEQRTETENTTEGVSQNTKIFHNALTDEYADQLDEAKKSTWKEQRANDLRQRIKRAMANRDRTKGDARAKWQEGINDMRRQLRKVLAEDIVDDEEELKESMPQGYSKSKFLKEMKDAVKDVKELADKASRFIDKGNLDDIRLIFKSIKGYCEMVEDNCQDIVNQEKKGVLKEGCMTKKFENMTNREVASYIFAHPHTKFASKMKECDDKEIMKAIRDMKKEMAEEAPVTNTSAVATAPKPSMYLKRPEQEELKDNQ